jgi:hypothetical protein
VSDAVEVESVESRLLGAGFARFAHLWMAPGDGRPLSQEDAIAALESGEIRPATVTVPAPSIAASEEQMDEWLGRSDRQREERAELQRQWFDELAEALRPVIRDEIRAALRKGRSS